VVAIVSFSLNSDKSAELPIKTESDASGSNTHCICETGENALVRNIDDT